jgi:hypothetical protein
MRYDECYLNATPTGKFCEGARDRHYERPNGTQFTACETHRVAYEGLVELTHRSD